MKGSKSQGSLIESLGKSRRRNPKKVLKKACLAVPGRLFD
jgi:hypothetical protein